MSNEFWWGFNVGMIAGAVALWGGGAANRLYHRCRRNQRKQE